MATLTVSNSTSPNGVPRISIVGASFANVDTLVYRVDPDGSRHVVRQASPVLPVSGAFTVYDYEAPFGESVSYEADDGTTSSSIVPTDPETPWLVHPGVPETSVAVKVLEWPSWSRPIVRGLFRPLGRREPIAVSQRRLAESGTLSVYTEGPAERDDLLALLDSGDALLLKGTSVEYAGTRWVSVGDVEETPHDRDLRGFVTWSLPIDTVSEPVGYALAPVSYSDATATFLSYADAALQAPTYADRSAGEWL